MSEDLANIVIISLIIALSPYLSRIVSISIAPLEIILGSIFTSLGLIHHSHLFELVAEFGFLYLMFLAGLEVDLSDILRMDRATIKKGLFFTLLLYILAFLSTYFFDLNILFSVIFSLISVGVLAALIKEYSKSRDWLNLALNVGIMGEVVSIVVLTVMSTNLHFGFGSKFYLTIFYLLFFILVIIVLFRVVNVIFWWYPALRTKLLPTIDNDEKDIRISFALLFVFISIMMYLELEVALGPFIAGIFIATFFEHKKSLPHTLSSFGFGFLVPIFFVHIGSLIHLSDILKDGLVLMALKMSAIMIGIRILSALIFKNSLGLSGATLFGLSLSMPLTLLIAASTIAYHTHNISEFEYLATILAAIFEVIFSMIAIKKIVKLSSTRDQTP